MGTALRRLAAEVGLDLVDDVDAADVIVDYSRPERAAALLDALERHPRPFLIGTTGLPDAAIAQITALSARVPAMRAPNTGTGIAVLRRLVRDAVRALPGWDVEIVELHHRKKVDAPSGTAWALLDAAGKPRDGAVTARDRGVRTDGEVGIQALRGGDVVGEHTVYLLGPGERIELTHRAMDRDTFARGGLRAAIFLSAPGRAPGLYTMDDVLRLG
jgi:4-hydroxy-tetrahydrodipicolinate reductase